MSSWSRVLRRIALNVRIAWRLGPGLGGRIRLLTAALLVHARQRLRPARTAGVRVRMRVFGRTFDWWLHDYSDLSVLREVLLEREYDVDLTTPPEVILDLGSNVGFSLIFFRLKYPRARIVGIEPDPVNVDRALRNLSGFDGITCRNVAVSDHNGTAKLRVDAASRMSSALSSGPGQSTVDVSVRTLDSLIEELALPRVDLIKFDIEGHELAVFRAFRGLEGVGALVGELHADLIGGSPAEFLSLFSGFDVAIEETTPGRRCIVRAIRRAEPRT